MAKFLAMDIGCIECGESSEVLGIFLTQEEADIKCEEMYKLGWRGGQHFYEVFEVEIPNG